MARQNDRPRHGCTCPDGWVGGHHWSCAGVPMIDVDTSGTVDAHDHCWHLKGYEDVESAGSFRYHIAVCCYCGTEGRWSAHATVMHGPHLPFDSSPVIVRRRVVLKIGE